MRQKKTNTFNIYILILGFHFNGFASENFVKKPTDSALQSTDNEIIESFFLDSLKFKTNDNKTN